MIPIEDLTDVSLAIEDTEENDEDDKDVADYPAMSFIFVSWHIKIQMPIGWVGWSTNKDDEEDLTDVTLVSDDNYWRLDRKLSSDESYQVMKVIYWRKLSSCESYPMMKVSNDEIYLVMKVIL